MEPTRTLTMTSASSPHDHIAAGGNGGPLTKCWTSKSRVCKGRVVFVLCLATTAAILALLAHTLLTSTETRLAREQFESISDRALEFSREIAFRQRLGIITLATMAGQNFPNKETWPFVNFQGFEVVANTVIETSSGQDQVGLLPFVYPDQLADFNQFGANLYPNAPFDRVTGLDSDTFERYNETLESNGETTWGSPNNVLVPFLYHSRGPMLFLANLHSLERQGKVIDDMIACSKIRAAEMSTRAHNNDTDNDTDFNKSAECSVLGDIVSLASKNPIENPAAVTYHPIYPAHNPETLVGLISSAVKWQDVLVKVFSDKVSGVDCVLKTATQVFTYQVTNGEATLKGQGDLHDRQFSSFGQTIDLTPPGVYGNSSAHYNLSVYPSDEFFQTYATENPAFATALAVCIIIFTSASFFLYDACVRQEFSDKEALLTAKRQFVRFISHEVRTPLNSVCMGLQLLKDEVNTTCYSNSQSKSAAEATTIGDTTNAATGNDGHYHKHMKAVKDISEDVLINALSAVDVLNDVLKYDKVESGSLQLELAVVNIWELIEQTSTEFRQQANCKIATYELDFSPLLVVEQEDLILNNKKKGNDIETPQATTTAKVENVFSSASQLPQNVKNGKVVGDKASISQVLRNLVSNALKFSPEQGSLAIRTVWKKPTGDVNLSEITLYSGEVVHYQGYGSLQVEVMDTGVGMTENQLKNLFREGVQFNVNELQAGQGSGLGLYIAKGILEAHGGSLTATSDGLGCGTKFTMMIPLYYVPGPEDQENIEDEKPKEGICPMSMEPLTVLVVDDARMNRKMLKRLLQNRGHNCDEAEDGIVAVQRVRDAAKAGKDYDSILMDYQMPEMDGPTAVKKIRELGCSAFIAGVTGNYFAEDISYFKLCGADVVLSKPLNLQHLVDTWMEHGVGS